MCNKIHSTKQNNNLIFGMTVLMSTQSRLIRNEQAMLHWMYGSKPDEFLSTVDLLTKFQVWPIKDMLLSNCLCWFGHLNAVQDGFHKIERYKFQQGNLVEDQKCHGML
jgi:hypothetical protein